MSTDIDRELIRRGVIVPTFKQKNNNSLNYYFKGRRYFDYSKARSKVRSLRIESASKWKKYCYLNDNLPYGVPESPEIVYRNNGWKNFSDWLGTKIVKKTNNKRRKRRTKTKSIKLKKRTVKLKSVNQVKNYKFSKLASKRLPKTLNAIKLVGNLSRKSSYEYTEVEAQTIIKSLSKAMRDLRKKFK